MVRHDQYTPLNRFKVSMETTESLASTHVAFFHANPQQLSSHGIRLAASLCQTSIAKDLTEPPLRERMILPI